MKYSLICGEQMNGQTHFLRAEYKGLWSSGRIFNYSISAPNSNATSVDQQTT